MRQAKMYKVMHKLRDKERVEYGAQSILVEADSPEAAIARARTAGVLDIDTRRISGVDEVEGVVLVEGAGDLVPVPEASSGE